MNLTRLIKEKALELGYCKAGITTADDFDQYLEIVHSRGEMYDFHRLNPMGPLAGARPRQIMPAARSILVLAFDYAQHSFPASLLTLLGRVYQARCYTPLPDSLNGVRLQAMIDFLRGAGLNVNDKIMIPARWAAAKAGIANFGRNTFAYVDGVGSFVILYTLALDQELEYDQPTLENKCPENCRACIKACPTNALYEPFKMNPYKCLAFNAWKTQAGTAGVRSAFIPHEIREKMELHVHGCDICQEACPRNKGKMKGCFPADQFLENIAPDLTLPNLLNMPDGFMERRVRPLMHNYIKEPRYFQRNAAVALGNLGDPSAVGDLSRALNSGDELVRGHAAWALGRLGETTAKSALEKRLEVEQSEEVKVEIAAALEKAAN
ncbi:PBS lyase [Deltaproteobacteria bacterium Smac51]|nr:PBS lyase [Deltaproteobacteria bacterium Smac51]